MSLTILAQVNANEPHPVTTVTVFDKRSANRAVAQALRTVANVIDEDNAFEEIARMGWPGDADA